jgi:hypothetical protein
MPDTPENEQAKPDREPSTSEFDVPGRTDSDTAEISVTRQSWRRRHWRPITILAVILVPVFIFAAWAAITLSYSFSTGELAGFAQKLSKRGWICKTWEGELAMVNLPGAMPEIFRFSIRNDSIARLLERNLGKRVSLSYSQHRGVPTSCFGETEYYITNVRILEP